MDFKGEDFQDGNNPIQSLQSPDPMAHSVFNHTLLSPRQVSINLAMQPHQQYSGLVGGRSSIGDRVIEKLAEDPSTKRAKEDVSEMLFDNSNYLSDMLSRPVSISQKKHTLINATCTITSKTMSQTTSNTAMNKAVDDDHEDDAASDDETDNSSDSDDDDDDNINGNEVEEFITAHISQKFPLSLSTPEYKTGAPSTSNIDRCNVTIHSLESFLQKTDELIKHNVLLQQQISTLKRETALQTKVLTKLLVKGKKMNRKKPYDGKDL